MRGLRCSEADRERRRRVHIYAQEWAICQLLRDGELGCEKLLESIFLFFQKNKNGEERWETTGVAQMVDVGS